MEEKTTQTITDSSGTHSSETYNWVNSNGLQRAKKDAYKVITEEFYDAYGNKTSTQTFNEDNLDGERFITEYVYYDEERLRKNPDEVIENGVKTEYIYDDKSYVLKEVIKGNQKISATLYENSKVAYQDKFVTTLIVNRIYDQLESNPSLAGPRLFRTSEYNKSFLGSELEYEYLYHYDYLGRVNKIINILSSSSPTTYDNALENILTKEITYKENTNLVNRVEYKFEQYDYKYDENQPYILVNEAVLLYNNYTYDNLRNVISVSKGRSYYDVETGWFWLSSRYYSPELCRFISPEDVFFLDPESVNGLNLYCYCYNDPINYYDPSGHFFITASIGLSTAAYYAIIALLAVTAVATTTYIESETHIIQNSLTSLGNAIVDLGESIGTGIDNLFSSGSVSSNNINNTIIGSSAIAMSTSAVSAYGFKMFIIINAKKQPHELSLIAKRKLEKKPF